MKLLKRFLAALTALCLTPMSFLYSGQTFGGNVSSTAIAADDVLYGDVNSDGQVDAIDVSLVLSEQYDYIKNFSAADVVTDGVINCFDAAAIIGFIDAQIARLPVEHSDENWGTPDVIMSAKSAYDAKAGDTVKITYNIIGSTDDVISVFDGSFSSDGLEILKITCSNDYTTTFYNSNRFAYVAHNNVTPDSIFLNVKIPSDCPDGAYTISLENALAGNMYGQQVNSITANDVTINVGEVTAAATPSAGEEYLEVKRFSDHIEIIKVKGNPTELVIPSKIDGLPVTIIGNNAFDGCTSLTSVTLPNSVTSIGNHSFANCTNLKSVTLPNSVKSIDGSAFLCCASLTSITLPNSVESIGDAAFYYCTNLTTVTIPNSVTSIAHSAFYGCTSLTTVTIPDSVTSIEYNTFYNCTSLTTVIIPNSVTSIGGGAFRNCKSLPSITIPNSVTSIGDAFYGCTGLTSVDIPDSVTSIKYNTFYNCTNLQSVNIPDSVTSIGDYAFYNCTKLTSVDIPNSVTSIDSYAFYNCENLESVTIPYSVESIGNQAFNNCTSLNSITFEHPECQIYNNKNTIPASCVIKGYYGSTAEDYAKKYDRTFEFIGKAPELTTTTTTTAKITTTTTAPTPTTTPPPNVTTTIPKESTTPPPITTPPTATTTTTTTTQKPYAPVTTEYVPEIEEQERENHKLNIVGDMVVKPMTKDEIVAAGIDLSSAENYHCYNYSIEMTFHDEPIIFTKYEAVPDSGASSGTKKVVSFSPPSSTSGRKVSVSKGESVYVPEMEATVGYYEYETQEMFIIVYGESKWLKEFYDVQLIVFNSDNETLENCSATLDVPQGLTLCNSKQTQYIGDLKPNGVGDIHWYLRGDEAGDYSLKALFKGKNDGDTFEYEFYSKNNLHVYAGDALKMTIVSPGYSCYHDTYKMNIALTNVSDRPIYNLENRIKNIDHGYYYERTIDNYGVIIHESGEKMLGGGSGKSIYVDELKPGESAVIEVSINDLWKSPLQENLEKSKLFIDALSLGLGRMPLASFCASLASSFLDGITVIHLIDSLVVTTLEGSTTEIPYEVEITGYTDEFIEDHTFDFVDAVVNSAISILPEGCKGIQQIYYGGKYYTERFDFYYDLVTNMQADAQKVSDGTMTLDEYIRRYNADYLQAITGVPIDIDNLKNMLEAADLGSIEIKGCNIPVTGIITVGEDLFKFINTPNNEVYVQCYITDADGNIIMRGDQQPQLQSGISLFGTRLMRASAEKKSPAYELNIVSGDPEYKDGVYTLKETSLVEIKAFRPNESAVVHLVYSDGHEAEYPLISVPEHECTGGNYHVVAPPDSANYGTAVQYCDVCGKFMHTKYIAKVATAMLSNGEVFQNVYDAVHYTEENSGEYELSIFGNITLNKDLVIPENVKLVITPYAYITFKNSAKIAASGEIDDYTSSLENIYENIVLEYWDGRTEIIQAEYGKELSELPDLTGECEFGGWYSDSEMTEPFVPFIAGEQGHSRIYYADIHHSFNSKGVCTKCGELENGRDAFLKAGVTINRDINLKFIAEISDKAASEGAYMVFEFPDGAIQTQSVAEAVNNEDGTYTFKCAVPINKMADVIKIQICYSNDVKGSYLEYSLKNYTDYIIANESSFDPTVSESIKALVNFGGYVQLYSGYNTENLINADLNMPLDNETVVIGDEYEAVKEIRSSSIEIKSANLSISDMAKINIKFTLKNGANVNDYKFTIDGKTVAPVKSGDVYILSIGRISPENYSKMYQFKIESKTNAEDYAIVDYSCFTYMRSVLNGDYDTDITNVMKAMYFYSQAIKNYIK